MRPDRDHSDQYQDQDDQQNGAETHDWLPSTLLPLASTDAPERI
jgi:hypothetical protein